MVRAKFRINRAMDITQPNYPNQTVIEMTPVMARDEHPENAMFGSTSPSGNISLTLVQPEGANAAEFFRSNVGKCVYVDFSIAEMVAVPQKVRI